MYGMSHKLTKHKIIKAAVWDFEDIAFRASFIQGGTLVPRGGGGGGGGGK